MQCERSLLDNQLSVYCSLSLICFLNFSWCLSKLRTIFLSLSTSPSLSLSIARSLGKSFFLYVCLSLSFILVFYLSLSLCFSVFISLDRLFRQIRVRAFEITAGSSPDPKVRENTKSPSLPWYL